jgi:predicted phosphodiesterase
MPNLPTRKFVICGDNHGDQAAPLALKAILDFCADFRPEVMIHLGDNWDLRSLRNKASDAERAESVGDDWEHGREFFEHFFRFGSERHFLRGNHDQRFWKLLACNHGPSRDFGATMVEKVEYLARKCRVKMLPYDSRHGVLSIGHLQVIHGYHTGITACAQHARIYGNSVFGHIHSIESYQVPGLTMKEARSIGCLCKLDMDYVAEKTAKLRWANGWAYGLLYGDGTYSIFQARNINGTYYAATNFKKY